MLAAVEEFPAGVAALLVFGWIASVALTRNPWGLLA